MISRYEAWLNGDALSSVNQAILINDISYAVVPVQYTTSQRGGMDGALTGADSIGTNTVTITFTVREYATWKRQEIVQDIAVWAMRGGWLTTSDRPNQRLYVRCAKPPAVTSVMRWLNTLTVEFAANDFPLWQDQTRQTVTLTRGQTGTLNFKSWRRTEAEALVTATAALTEISVTCGETEITLEGLSIAAGQTVEIRYTDDHHILEIVSGGVSLLDKRTAQSDDDLIAQPGENAVGFTADGAATCEIRVMGVYA